MFRFFTLCALVISISVEAQTPCDNNMAGPFPCNGYDLVSQITLSTMNSVKANDSWGWIDPLDGKEYAIICLNEATAFIDISDPINPIYLGQLPGFSSDHTTWRDAKTYNNHAFIVSEDTGHGMQVFDLTRLRDVSGPPVLFTEDAHYSGFGSAHNIAINEETGFAYAIGTDTFSNGPHYIDISDPVNPVAAGGHAADGYTHDAHVVVYDGPDSDYTGKEILIGSNETQVVILDVTDKANTQTIATIAYTNVHYTHQGWLTEDHRYFILGDETDEINSGINSRTIIFDFEDLDNPQFHFEYEGPTAATDHNGYVKGNQFYLANNAAGLRVIDISDIANGNMTEEGFFDSFPDNNNSGFNGSWSIYPYFESGMIVISDRAEGMLLVKPSQLGVANLTSESSFSMHPNPTSEILTISASNENITTVTIVDVSGKVVYTTSQETETSLTVDISAFSDGMYFVNVNNMTVKKLIKE